MSIDQLRERSLAASRGTATRDPACAEAEQMLAWTARAMKYVDPLAPARPTRSPQPRKPLNSDNPDPTGSEVSEVSSSRSRGRRQAARGQTKTYEYTKRLQYLYHQATAVRPQPPQDYARLYTGNQSLTAHSVKRGAIQALIDLGAPAQSVTYKAKHKRSEHTQVYAGSEGWSKIHRVREIARLMGSA